MVQLRHWPKVLVARRTDFQEKFRQKGFTKIIFLHQFSDRKVTKYLSKSFLNTPLNFFL